MTGYRCRTVLLWGTLALALGACELIPPTLPNYPVQKQTVWLDQGWTPEERDRYHRTDQGTLTFAVPYEWFVALE